VLFAVNGAVATPEVLVIGENWMELLLNKPDAPLLGAVNWITTFDTGLLWASVTVTASAFAKAVLTLADCGVVPALAVMIDAGPGLLATEKLVETAPAAALML
jgi:hypothetical protein